MAMDETTGSGRAGHMTDTKDEQITKETLQQLHQQKMSDHNYTNNMIENKVEIVEIFGGIDNVVNICLKSNDVILNNNKLETLHEIINSQSEPKQKNILSQEIVNNIDIKKVRVDTMQFEYTFDVNNTFLHSICGDIKAHKIKQCVENKVLLTFYILAVCIGIALSSLLGGDSVISNIYQIICLCVLWIPWLLLKHSLFNKHAFKLCVKTFDYWIKVGYGIMWS
eukprot:520147_1